MNRTQITPIHGAITWDHDQNEISIVDLSDDMIVITRNEWPKLRDFIDKFFAG